MLSVPAVKRAVLAFTQRVTCSSPLGLFALCGNKELRWGAAGPYLFPVSSLTGPSAPTAAGHRGPRTRSTSPGHSARGQVLLVRETPSPTTPSTLVPAKAMAGSTSYLLLLVYEGLFPSLLSVSPTTMQAPGHRDPVCFTT